MAMTTEKGWREDGRLEQYCEHRIGHTVEVPPQYALERSWWVHGCDGCCGELSAKTPLNNSR